MRDAVGLRGPCDVPKPVQEAIAACLEFERGRRPWNVYQLAQRMGLEQSDWGETPAAGPQGPQQTRKWLPRIKIAAFIGIRYAVLALVGPRVMERVWTKPNEPLLSPEAKPPPALAQPPQFESGVNPSVSPSAASGLPVPVTLAVMITNVTAPPPAPPPLTPSVAPIASPPVTNEVAKPIINTRPAARTVRIGDELVLHAEVIGAPALAYQWLKDTKPLANGTASALLLQPVVAASSGEYGLIVQNAGGAVTSQVATIRVLPALPRSGRPWTNSLGMVFLPLRDSTALLAHSETRLQDFNLFRAAAHLRTNTPSIPQDIDHPVVCVSWKETEAFCRWLTERERETGQLGSDQYYRLPLLAEWLAAALPRTEATPPLYAWGNDWPPPLGLGNLPRAVARQEIQKAVGQRTPAEDRFQYTAPTGRFQANEAGFVDLVGNVAEWLADKLGGQQRFAIGGGWDSSAKTEFLLLAPPKVSEEKSLENLGFRCLLDTGPQVGEPQR